MTKDDIFILRGASKAFRIYQRGDTARGLAEDYADLLDEMAERFIAEFIDGTGDNSGVDNTLTQRNAARDRPDFTRAHGLTPEIEAEIEQAFNYQKWTPEQEQAGVAIRTALANAVKAIVAGAPPSPDRSAAIRKVREARMDANSAITHAGRY